MSGSYGQFTISNTALRVKDSMSSEPDRAKVQEELLERVRSAAALFYAAAAEHAKAVAEFGGMLAHPDGTHAVLQTARGERQAIEDYSRALKALFDSFVFPLVSLVEDDEADLRSVIARILRRDGFETIEAQNGEQALAVIRNLGARITVVVSDIRMPLMSGCDLAKAVGEEFPQIPVLLMSAFADAAPVRYPFIAKPFRAEALLAKLRDVLSHRATRTT